MTQGTEPGQQHGDLGRPATAASSAGPHDLLTRILASVRQELAVTMSGLPRAELARLAQERAPRGDLFAAALARPGRLNVIAECKRQSPSKGVLCRSYEPARVARAYQAAGAAAVSVLTEPNFFAGAIDHLREVRAAVSLPLLRKDFIVDEYQLLESRAAGADAVLLIVAALDEAALEDLIRRSAKLGLAALVEVHDGSDLERAIAAGAAIIGVNNRDLRTLRVDLETSARMIRRIPAGVIAVAESGIDSCDALEGLRACGFGAFLIGGHLMTNPDPGRALRELLTRADRTERSERGDS